MVNITVKGIISASIDTVYKVLKDPENYKNWWGFSVVGNNKEQIFTFEPIPFIKVGIFIEELSPSWSISYRYTRGLLRGSGQWRLEQTPGNAESTNLTYTVQLYSRNKFINVVIATHLFRVKHTSDIKRLIARLNKHVLRIEQ